MRRLIVLFRPPPDSRVHFAEAHAPYSRLPRHAAVDRQHLAGDVAGGGAGEEEDAGGDVFGEAEPLGGDSLFHFVENRVAQGLGHLAFDEAGADGVDRHFAAGELAAEAAGEADEAGFGGGVVGLARRFP